MPKYFNFFVSSLVCAAGLVGWHIDSLTADILLPVGISFYTFQAIGYSIDVSKKRIPASHAPVSFFAYVCFFPQLVAGPIERARNLLPQFGRARTFDYSQAMDGSRQMLWGFFKKLVIADKCAMLADPIFRSPSNYSGIDSGIGLILFFFQIYGDFSGYSDIAIGTAKLFGIRLTRNFNAPMFSRNIAEFWRRWHISLNSWFFDYVFSAMKGWNRKWRVALNVLIVFMLSGFWHGASVKFILWGLYFGVLSIPFFIKIKPLPTVEVAGGRLIPSLKEFFQMMSTFILVLLAEPFFRCQSVRDAFIYYKSLVTDFSLDISIPVGFALPGFICLLLILEWIFRGREYPFQVGLIRNTACRYAIVIIMLLFIYFHCAISPSNFIYFDF